MAKWVNGAPVDQSGLVSGQEDLRNFLQTYIQNTRKQLEKERDYLIEYFLRVSGRDVRDKDLADLTAEEVEKLLR